LCDLTSALKKKYFHIDDNTKAKCYLKLDCYTSQELVSDCCLTSTQQFSSYIMARTSKFSMTMG
jgi:hypothetical protein